jgi:hypothetical protein
VKGKENYVCIEVMVRKFKSVMRKQGYRKTSSDHCVFVQKFLMMILSFFYFMLMTCLLLVKMFLGLIG